MTKLEKIDKELDKAREKAAEWQAKVRDLEKQRQEEENSMRCSVNTGRPWTIRPDHRQHCPSGLSMV